MALSTLGMIRVKIIARPEDVSGGRFFIDARTQGNAKHGTYIRW